LKSQKFQKAFFGIYLAENAKAMEIRDTIKEDLRNRKYL
jgi:hypothetical protein